MRHAITLALLAGAAALGWVSYSLATADTHVHTTRQTNSAFVWGDRVPLNQTMLARWLKARGSLYTVWALRHPAAAEILGPR